MISDVQDMCAADSSKRVYTHYIQVKSQLSLVKFHANKIMHRASALKWNKEQHANVSLHVQLRKSTFKWQVKYLH